MTDPAFTLWHFPTGTPSERGLQLSCQDEANVIDQLIMEEAVAPEDLQYMSGFGESTAFSRHSRCQPWVVLTSVMQPNSSGACSPRSPLTCVLLLQGTSVPVRPSRERCLWGRIIQESAPTGCTLSSSAAPPSQRLAGKPAT